MRKLIVFYSRAGENFFAGKFKNVDVGNTEIVAGILHTIIDADLFKIEQEIPYSDVYKECVQQSLKDFKENARPVIKNLMDSLKNYDEIYLGFPNYCGTMPMAVYTFLETFDFSGKVIHPFMTHEGSGLCNTVAEIQEHAKGSCVTNGIAILGREANDAEQLLKNWIQSF